MANQQTLVLTRPIDPHDLGPQQIDIHLFPPVEHSVAHSVRATLPVLSTDGPTRLILTHPIHVLQPLALAAGNVEVETLQQSSICLLCLGGQVSFDVQPEASTCRLQSSAPMILMGKSFFDNDLNPIDLFTSEFEAWLSIMRARARGDTAAFYRLLTRIPPFTLYAQGLVLAARRLAEVPVEERHERYWRSYNVLHGALAAARKRPNWPNPLPNLEALLAVSPRA
jgi:hypothetical protein